jgi:hypothetical protein
LCRFHPSSLCHGFEAQLNSSARFNDLFRRFTCRSSIVCRAR